MAKLKNTVSQRKYILSVFFNIGVYSGMESDKATSIFFLSKAQGGKKNKGCLKPRREIICRRRLQETEWRLNVGKSDWQKGFYS